MLRCALLSARINYDKEGGGAPPNWHRAVIHSSCVMRVVVCNRKQGIGLSDERPIFNRKCLCYVCNFEARGGGHFSL